ncbi:LOW QUALITY PROTEIN: hypothetical protein QTO34_008829 [Cnephaeus nilssonii]|uniref:Uncharacterized protein n=1 Tax=Cnephaeus nilssonii TaxID=3371016 RepID=A0AA40LG24_CNENI|nr:LOW QUALITY PROTEIN: hypothetical protein QTO34_008829 [Eptesicus nilssonii]
MHHSSMDSRAAKASSLTSPCLSFPASNWEREAGVLGLHPGICGDDVTGRGPGLAPSCLRAQERLREDTDTDTDTPGFRGTTDSSFPTCLLSLLLISLPRLILIRRRFVLFFRGGGWWVSGTTDSRLASEWDAAQGSLCSRTSSRSHQTPGQVPEVTCGSKLPTEKALSLCA